PPWRVQSSPPEGSQSRRSSPKRFPASAWFQPAPGLPPRRPRLLPASISAEDSYPSRERLSQALPPPPPPEPQSHREHDPPMEYSRPRLQGQSLCRTRLEPHCWRSTEIRPPGARAPCERPHSEPAR